MISTRMCGPVEASVQILGAGGGAGRGDRVVHSPVHCIVQGGQLPASLSKPVCLFIFSNVNMTRHLNPPELASAV